MEHFLQDLLLRTVTHIPQANPSEIHLRSSIEKNGAMHVFLLPDVSEKMEWQDAVTWSKQFKDASLLNPEEQYIAAPHVGNLCYWSSKSISNDKALYFSTKNQMHHVNLTTQQHYARAVRRVFISNSDSIDTAQNIVQSALNYEFLKCLPIADLKKLLALRFENKDDFHHQVKKQMLAYLEKELMNKDWVTRN